MNRYEIVLDAGHGDTDAGRSTANGVLGPSGVREKDVTLSISERAQSSLGATAVLTRRRGESPSLQARAELAQRFGARAFVSVHANAGMPGERGTEVWVHERGSIRSRALAESILQRLSALPDAPARSALRFGSLSVLTPELLGADTAACLVEVDYLTDRDGERRLASAQGAHAIGAAVARGAQAFLCGAKNKRFGEVETAVDCTGWEGDCESMAKVIADRMFYNYLKRDQKFRAQTIKCDGNTAVVMYENGEAVDVSWNPSKKTASATKFMNPPPGLRGIIESWCEYSYTCSTSGSLVLANDSCFP